MCIISTALVDFHSQQIANLYIIEQMHDELCDFCTGKKYLCMQEIHSYKAEEIRSAPNSILLLSSYCILLIQ